MSVIVIIILAIVIFVVITITFSKNLKKKAFTIVEKELNNLQYSEHEYNYSNINFIKHRQINKNNMLVGGSLKYEGKIINQFQALVHFEPSNKYPILTNLIFRSKPPCINKPVRDTTDGYAIDHIWKFMLLMILNTKNRFLNLIPQFINEQTSIIYFMGKYYI